MACRHLHGVHSPALAPSVSLCLSPSAASPSPLLPPLPTRSILMWAGNNVTRPFRLAGAAALAPFMDRLMEKLQVGCRFGGLGSSGNHHSRRGTLQQLSSSREALPAPNAAALQLQVYRFVSLCASPAGTTEAAQQGGSLCYHGWNRGDCVLLHPRHALLLALGARLMRLLHARLTGACCSSGMQPAGVAVAAPWWLGTPAAGARTGA